MVFGHLRLAFRDGRVTAVPPRVSILRYRIQTVVEERTLLRRCPEVLMARGAAVWLTSRVGVFVVLPATVLLCGRCRPHRHVLRWHPAQLRSPGSSSTTDVGIPGCG